MWISNTHPPHFHPVEITPVTFGYVTPDVLPTSIWGICVLCKEYVPEGPT